MAQVIYCKPEDVALCVEDAQASPTGTDLRAEALRLQTEAEALHRAYVKASDRYFVSGSDEDRAAMFAVWSVYSLLRAEAGSAFTRYLYS